MKATIDQEKRVNQLDLNFDKVPEAPPSEALVQLKHNSLRLSLVQGGLRSTQELLLARPEPNSGQISAWILQKASKLGW